MEQHSPSEHTHRGRVRWPNRMLGVLTFLALALMVAFLWAWRYRNDKYLADFIMRSSNPALRGRLELKRVHWGVRALVDLAMGVPTPVEIEHFAVYDPRGDEVILAPQATGKVALWPLITGGHLIVHDLIVPTGRCRVESKPFGGPHDEVGLVAAFAPVKPSGGRGPRIELLDYDFGSVDLLLRFPGWSLHLLDLQSRGSFVLTGGPVAVEGVRYKLQPRASSGLLTVEGVEVPLRDLRAERFEAWPPRPLDLGTKFTVDAGGTLVQVDGFLLNIYGGEAGIDMQIKAANAQTLAARLLGPGAAGPGWLEARATGSLVRPVLEGRVDKVSVAFGKARATEVSARVVLDAKKRRIGATEVSGSLLGGRVVGAGGLNLANGNWSLRADLTEVGTGILHPLVDGAITGKLRVRGTTTPLVGAQLEVAADLQRRRRDWIPQKLRLGGTAYLDQSIIDLAGFSVSGDGHRVIARGSVNLRTRAVNMYLSADASRLGPWLQSRGLPDLVQTAKGHLHVRGRWPALHAAGPVEARGVGLAKIRLPHLRGELELANGTIYLRKARAEGLGGRLTGGASLRLSDGRLDRLLAQPLLQASVSAHGIDLTALGLGQWAAGQVNADAEVNGPLDGLTGTANVRAPTLRLLGESYKASRARLGLLRDRVSIYRAALARSGGGSIELRGDVYSGRKIDLQLKASAFPVTAIPGVGSVPLGLQADISGTVHATGGFADPRLEGRLRLSQVRLRGVDLGGGEISFSPGSDNVHITGHVLGKSALIDGYLLYDPQWRLNLAVDVVRFPLDKLLYEMHALGDARASIDGRVQLQADARSGLTWGSVKLSRAEVVLLYLPPGERRQRRIELSSAAEMTALYDGRELRVEPVRLVSRIEGRDDSRAEFTLGGVISRNGPDLWLQGRVALAIAEFLFARQLKQVQGQASTDVRLRGRFDDLNLQGKVDLGPVSLRLAAFRRDINLRGASLLFTPGKIQLKHLDLEVDQARLAASGELQLKQFRPDQASLRLTGDLSMRLVQLFFPEQFSAGSGMAGLDIRVSGPVRDPQLMGTLRVKHIELSPRGWGRSLTLDSGDIELSNYLIKTVRPLEGTYDEGAIRVSGEVRLDRWEPVDIYLKIAGTGIPQRQPNVYTAEANVNLTLLGDSSQLSLKGNVDLVDARYVRPFDVFKLVIRPKVFEEETPFWKSSPLLSNLQLRLNVQSTGQLSVKNDYATLSLSGALTVGGILAEPRLGGQVRVEDGKFRIPLMKGEYTITRGEVNFSERKSIDNAEISITGETPFLDRNGVDYLIKLTLLGPLNNIAIQLSSTPALDQGQILALLATGRTTDQLRKQMKGSDTSTPVFGVADTQVKMLTGEILNSIIEEPLKKITGLDLVKLEVGTESVHAGGCQNLGRYAKLCGDYEYGMTGDTRSEGRMEIKISDMLKLVGKYERINTRLEIVDPQRGRGELKLRWLPFR